MKRSIGVIGALTLGLGLALAAPTAAGAAGGTIYVPGDMDFSQTRTTGHYEVQGTGLHVWTEGATSTDKVAGYVSTSTSLADVGEPALELTNNTTGTIPPGYQLVVDFDGNGSADGILVGEPSSYGNDWWATDSSAPFVLASAPSHAGGSGSSNHGTLDQWRGAFPGAVVKAFGFSLGSGVKGDWTIDAINFAGTRYTFAERVVLTSKDACKDGGWTTSTHPVFKNQGECVSSFASKKKAASFSA